VVYGCEKYRSHLEHKDFCHHTDNEAMASLLRHAEKLGRRGRWVLRLSPFKYKVCHVSGKTNVGADCLTRQYEDLSVAATFMGLVLQHLSEAFQSIQEHQMKTPFCKDLYLEDVRADPAARHFKLFNGALVYHISRASVKCYLLSESIRPMVLQYFHGWTLGVHLGVTETLSRIGKVSYWPNIRADVCKFVRGCQMCQRAKPAQDTRVGHSSEVVARPLGRVFINFLGPLSEAGGEILPYW
jgi:hypothetical protein